jgi:hypothetical protein
VLRRRRLPEHLRVPHEAFLLILREVEAAKETVVAAVPTARLPGRPLADALLEFDERLADAETGMPEWLHRDVQAEWRACADGLTEARRRGERFRLGGHGLAFDATVFALQDLIAPLEPFEAAAHRFRSLRR